MKVKPLTYLDFALKYQKEYNNTKWWKFSKRKRLKALKESALDLLIRSYKP